MTQNEKLVWAAVFAQTLIKERERTTEISAVAVAVAVSMIVAKQTIETMRKVDPGFDKHIDEF